MKLVYASRTGNVEKLVNRLNADNVLKITTGEETVDEPVLLITYTDGVGQLPAIVAAFVEKNRPYVKAAAVSGNKERHPNTFGFAANVLKDTYQVPVLTVFNKDGDDETDAVIRNALNA
jgi:protein involved in ribonucleotide reduction